MSKSFRELSLSITEPQYRDIDAISYSMASKFQGEGFRSLPTLYDRIETPSLTFGSVVDTMLTDGMDEFERKYMVCDFPQLTDSLVAITKELYSLCCDTYSAVLMGLFYEWQQKNLVIWDKGVS